MLELIAGSIFLGVFLCSIIGLFQLIAKYPSIGAFVLIAFSIATFIGFYYLNEEEINTDPVIKRVFGGYFNVAEYLLYAIGFNIGAFIICVCIFTGKKQRNKNSANPSDENQPCITDNTKSSQSNEH